MRARQYSQARGTMIPRTMMRSKVIRWLAGVVIALLGAVLAFEVLTVAFIVALQRSAAFRDWVRHFNKKRLNPAMLTQAGRKNSPNAVVHHVGRRSDQQYMTPVRVRETPEGFIVPLPYGPDTDWCRNVLAAEGAVITWQGRDYPVEAPAVMSIAAAATRVPLPPWRAWLWTSLVPRSPLGNMRCLWVKRRTPISGQARTEAGEVARA